MVTSKLPVVLCLHGGGTSGDIFNVQARNLRSRLRKEFELIFITAAQQGPAGPGVLPYFADAGPFYWWFGGQRKDASSSDAAALQEKMKQLSNEFVKIAAVALSAKGRGVSDVVGLMGFSEGTLASSLFLSQSSRTWEKAEGRPRPFINLSFGVLICPGYRSDVAVTVAKYPVKLPTIHIHGLKDPILSSSRALLKAYNSPDLVSCIEFDGSHHVPSQPEVLDQIAQQIHEAYVSGMQMKMGFQKPIKDLTASLSAIKLSEVSVRAISHRAAVAA